jgi:DNA-binding NarL/FixJ family response regulator
LVLVEAKYAVDLQHFPSPVALAWQLRRPGFEIRLTMFAGTTALSIGMPSVVGGDTMNRPRVLLADNHRLLREAFAALLEPHCEVVGTVADGRELLAVAAALNPDVIILEVALPRLNGLDAGRELKRLMPAVKLVYLTASGDPELTAELLQIGAERLLLKSSEASELLRAIREVSAGCVCVTPADAASTGPVPYLRVRRRRSGGLSPRRRDVLRLLAEGHSMKQVARKLNLSPRTIAYHKYGMMEELGLRTNAKLIQYAFQRQLVPA